MPVKQPLYRYPLCRYSLTHNHFKHLQSVYMVTKSSPSLLRDAILDFAFMCAAYFSLSRFPHGCSEFSLELKFLFSRPNLGWLIGEWCAKRNYHNPYGAHFSSILKHRTLFTLCLNNLWSHPLVAVDWRWQIRPWDIWSCTVLPSTVGKKGDLQL